MVELEAIKTVWAQVDEEGRLVLPAQIVEKYGLKPGAHLRIDENVNDFRLHRPITHLAKVYIEPTDLCNLDCTFCIRNGWDEPMGRMSQATFDQIYASLEKLDPLPTVFFGGLGEPLFHPHTIEWIARVKALGARVELITNGTTLTEKRSRELIDTGLDLMWVSIDGATPESYADVRLGAALPNVVENVARFRKMRRGSHRPKPEIGISFVAMQRNIRDLPDLLKLGNKVGAKRFFITNVMPYTEDMQKERLYGKSMMNIAYMSSPWLPKLGLPKMDMDATTIDSFYQAINSGCNVQFAGNSFSGANDVCSFIESGSLSIRWDGGVSPCWPLMHNHISYLHGKERRSTQHIIANVRDRDLTDIWDDRAYTAYRTRVQGFAFAPCTFCGGCDLSTANLEDCLGNEFPACGGCLWAQGIIQCP